MITGQQRASSNRLYGTMRYLTALGILTISGDVSGDRECDVADVNLQSLVTGLVIKKVALLTLTELVSSGKVPAPINSIQNNANVCFG